MKIDSINYPNIGDTIIEDIDGQQHTVKFMKHVGDGHVCAACFYYRHPHVPELKDGTYPTTCYRPTSVCQSRDPTIREKLSANWQEIVSKISPNGGDI